MNRKATLGLTALMFALGTAGCASTHTRRLPDREVKLLSSPPRMERARAARGELGAAIDEVRRVQFRTGSYELDADAQARLAEAARLLRRYPDVAVYAMGHADERGQAGENEHLALRRAHAIAGTLMVHGVPSQRLHVVTFGERRPRAREHRPAAWAENRRVEVQFVRAGARLVALPTPTPTT